MSTNEDNNDQVDQPRQSDNAGLSTPPTMSDPTRKVEPTSESARKLRQEQQRQRKEQWQRKFVGVAQEAWPKLEEEMGGELVAEMEKCEMELLSNGKFLTMYLYVCNS